VDIALDSAIENERDDLVLLQTDLKQLIQITEGISRNNYSLLRLVCSMTKLVEYLFAVAVAVKDVGDRDDFKEFFEECTEIFRHIVILLLKMNDIILSCSFRLC